MFASLSFFRSSTTSNQTTKPPGNSDEDSFEFIEHTEAKTESSSDDFKLVNHPEVKTESLAEGFELVDRKISHKSAKKVADHFEKTQHLTNRPIQIIADHLTWQLELYKKDSNVFLVALQLCLKKLTPHHTDAQAIHNFKHQPGQILIALLKRALENSAWITASLGVAIITGLCEQIYNDYQEDFKKNSPITSPSTQERLDYMHAYQCLNTSSQGVTTLTAEARHIAEKANLISPKSLLKAHSCLLTGKKSPIPQPTLSRSTSAPSSHSPRV